MKVLLIKPTTKTDAITPPLGLGYLAARIRGRHNVRILDGPLMRLNLAMLSRILKEFRPDVVGFQLLTMDMVRVWRYLSKIREELPQAITVVGGPQPSGEPEGTLHWYGDRLNYAFVGEAEEGFSRLLDAIEGSSDRRPAAERLREIPGLVWRETPQVLANPPRREQDLDALGFPAWDMMDPRKYPPAPHAAFARAFPVGCITATRGCPFDCDFCAARLTQGKKLRTRSVLNVLDEIALLVNHYGVREIHMIDDNFTYNRDYVLDFCEQKARKFPNIPWTCPNGVRLDTLDSELLGAMKRSGCYILAVGIESGSQPVLDLAGKKQTVDLIREKVELIHRAGLGVVGFFIFGLPGETPSDIKETVKLSLELPLTRAQYMFYHPIPGTRGYKHILRERAECLRRIESAFETVAYVEKGLTEKQLKRSQHAAFLRFYLRPEQFASLLASIKHPLQIYYIARRIARWMIFN